MHSQWSKRASVLAGATSLIAACLVTFDVTPAGASCETMHHNLSGYDGNVGESYIGSRGQTFTNTFSSSQCSSTRSIIASGSSGSNQVEFGWFVDGGTGPHVPFAVWIVDGNIKENDNPGPAPGLANMGNSTTFHTYEVVNANQNTYWAYNFDGTYLESHQVAALSNGAYYATSNDERHNGGDDLHATFKALKDCRVIDNCNWLGYGTLSFMRQPTGADSSWVFCRDSLTAYHVNLNSCP